MNATKHGYKRAKQRLGLPKPLLEPTMAKVRMKGLMTHQMRGQLLLWAMGKEVQHDCQIIIHNGTAYAFGWGERLLTTYPLSGRLRALYERQKI